MVNELNGIPNPFFLLSADDRKIVRNTLQRSEIQADLFTLYAWARRNSMLLKVMKTTFSSVSFTIPDKSGIRFPLLLVSQTKALGDRIDFSLKPDLGVKPHLEIRLIQSHIYFFVSLLH